MRCTQQASNTIQAMHHLSCIWHRVRCTLFNHVASCCHHGPDSACCPSRHYPAAGLCSDDTVSFSSESQTACTHWGNVGVGAEKLGVMAVHSYCNGGDVGARWAPVSETPSPNQQPACKGLGLGAGREEITFGSFSGPQSSKL